MPNYENLEPTHLDNLPKVLRWMLTRRRGPWPRWVDSTLGPDPEPLVTGRRLRSTLISHATLLIQGNGLNLLTDPHWGLRSSPVQWAGPKRVRAVGLAMQQLPKIDVILLSHNHYDHMDLNTLSALLAAHPGAQLLTGMGVARSLPKQWRSRAVELDWWDSHEIVPGIRATYTPGRHFSARTPFDRWKSRWGGFHVNLAGGAIYFAGDTGYGQHFRQIRERLEPIRLALLPIGAYEPRWFMQHHHMNPYDAVEAFHDLGAAWAMGMHYGTFRLTDEAYDEPLKALALALEKAGMREGRFVTKEFGEAWEVGER